MHPSARRTGMFIALISSHHALAGAFFTPLGYLDPTASPPGSFATGLSADGAVVVGTSYFFDGETTQTRAFRWTPVDGMTNLGVPPKTLSSSMGGRVSNDGTIVVGSIGFTISPSFEIRNAAWWNINRAGTGKLLAGGLSTTDVTADGEMLVGVTRIPGVWPIPDQAFKYTPRSGVVELGFLPGGSYSWAAGVNADGSVIVGFGDLPGQVTAFKWTESTGLQPLAGQPDGVPSQANAVSPDGTIIVGYLNEQPIYWTESTGFVPLGLPEGAWLANALDLAADGSVIVGMSMFEEGDRGFVWDSIRGPRLLAAALEGEGVSLNGFTPSSVTGISDDGRTLVGWGINADGLHEGFIARLPALGDLDDNGIVDGADLGLLLAAWGTSDAIADLNDDKSVDGADLGILLSTWS